MSNKDYSNLSKEELIKIINKLKQKKKFGLVWEERLIEEDIVKKCQSNIPYLDEDISKRVCVDEKLDSHLIIEGDNFHTLNCLSFTHKNKIDVIYVDPPYNTGAKDWKYNNDYVDDTDNFRHSKWLSFMNHRLKLTKNLLKDDGFIIVAIDDYEVFTLGMLLDEIYGEKNRVGIIPVRNNPPGRTMSNYFATTHEYYLFYAKNKRKVNIGDLKLNEVDLTKYKYKDNISFYERKSLCMRGHGGVDDRPKNYYPVFYNEKENIISLSEIENSIKIYPHIGSNGKQRVWDNPKESMQKLIEENNIDITSRKDGSLTLSKKNRISRGVKPKSLWVESKYDSSAHGAGLLKKIFDNKKMFDYPKSIYAVMDALTVTLKDKKDSIVLDFFAGSGTTGHAVLELNKLDKGNRQFILCTNNENNIAQDVCYPRIKKCIEGYKDGSDLISYKANLKYYKSLFLESNTKVVSASDKHKIELAQKAGCLLSIAENTLDEVEHTSHFQFFKSNDRNTAIYFQEDLSALDAFVNKVEKLENPTTVYLFSWGNKSEFESMFDHIPNINIKTIPQPILEIYKKIYYINN